MKLNENEQKVLRFLAELPEGHCCAFASISEDTKLDRKQVRRACRSLARKGLAEYHRILWTDDGEVAGAGYGITLEGEKAAEPLLEVRRREDEYQAEYGSWAR